MLLGDSSPARRSRYADNPLLSNLARHAAYARASIELFEPESLDQILIAHKGQPFILIRWLLDCGPALAALSQEQRRHLRLNIATLATVPQEHPQTSMPLLGERLRALALTSGAWAFGETPPEQLCHAVDPKWHWEMPRSYWFNAQGERVAHSGGLTLAVIARARRRRSARVLPGQGSIRNFVLPKSLVDFKANHRCAVKRSANKIEARLTFRRAHRWGNDRNFLITFRTCILDFK